MGVVPLFEHLNVFEILRESEAVGRPAGLFPWPKIFLALHHGRIVQLDVGRHDGPEDELVRLLSIRYVGRSQMGEEHHLPSVF
jgi:hypothetical protein